MGILNITPDSFSDGGVCASPVAAVERGRKLLADGADLLDIGGESTRPGADPVPAEAEAERVLPVIAALRETFPETPLSIDTHKADVADAAVAAGADLINDVWGGLHGLGPEARLAWREAVARDASTADLPASPMAAVAARRGCPIILMHNREERRYGDFWPDLLLDLRVCLALARAAGVPARQIWLDPGFGFGKEPRHNLEVMKELDRITSLGFPVLLGTSRKSTLGLVLDKPVDQRTAGTAATAVWGVAKGCRMIRLHEPAEARDEIRMADAIREGLRFQHG